MPLSYEPPTLLSGFSFYLYKYDIATSSSSQPFLRTNVLLLLCWSVFETTQFLSQPSYRILLIQCIVNNFFNLFPLFKSRGISICPLSSYLVLTHSLSSARTCYTSGSKICMFHPVPFHSYPHSSNTYTVLHEI